MIIKMYYLPFSSLSLTLFVAHCPITTNINIYIIMSSERFPHTGVPYPHPFVILSTNGLSHVSTFRPPFPNVVADVQNPVEFAPVSSTLAF